jgi:hypothetical protein
MFMPWHRLIVIFPLLLTPSLSLHVCALLGSAYRALLRAACTPASISFFLSHLCTTYLPLDICDADFLASLLVVVIPFAIG